MLESLRNEKNKTTNISEVEGLMPFKFILDYIFILIRLVTEGEKVALLLIDLINNSVICKWLYISPINGKFVLMAEILLATFL